MRSEPGTSRAPRFAVLLGLLALALPGAAPAQSARAFERAYRAGDWAAAARAGESWASREPGNPTAAYNTACAHALAGDAGKALLWLERAGENGFAGVRSLDDDPDLATARADPGFVAATASIRANRARMFAEFKARAERAEILTYPPPSPPPGPRPLVLVLHGFGDEPRRNAELYLKAARRRGALVAAPSGLRPGPGGQGFSWTFRDESEWWVLRAIERLAAEHPVDLGRVILAGFSQGANVALEVGLRHPERFAGVLAVAGQYEAGRMPAPAGDGAPAVYLLMGERDPRADTFRAAERALREAGLEVGLRMIPGLGHSYPQRVTAEIGRALDFLLRE